MESQLMLWPVLAHVMLVLGLYVLLGRRKFHAVRQGQVDTRKAALDNRQWPEAVVKVSNAIANQFEAPVMFHVLALSLIALNAVNLASLVVSWLFVISRYWHAVIHVGNNYVPHRMRVFALGMVMILLLVTCLGWQLIGL